MKVVEIINEINKLSTVDKERLLSHFKYLLMPLHSTRPVFQEISETKAKNGLCCVHITASNVVRFGTFEVKNGLKTVKRQPYRCKNCQKTFTESTATPIYRTRKSNRWLEFIECMLSGLSLRESAKKMKGISHTTLFFGDIKSFLPYHKLKSIHSKKLLKWTKLTSYTLKKESVKSQEENLANGVVNLNLEGLVTNKYVY